MARPLHLHRHLAIALLPVTILAAAAQTPKAPAAPQHAAITTKAEDPILRGFRNPPQPALLRCYWWWLNGHTTKDTITRDLTEMQHKGYGGVLLVDAGGASQNGNNTVPAGPQFGSPEWTALYLHALKVANQLGLEVTLNITSGWNLGGPWVKPENASKLLTWSRTTVTPGTATPTKLAAPPETNNFYRQIAVLAYPLDQGPALPGQAATTRKPLGNLHFKNASAEMNFSMPDATNLLFDANPSSSPDQDATLDQVQDITAQTDPDGTTHWTPPADAKQSWEILRIGYTSSDARVSTSSDTWQGLAIDYLDPTALDLYWNTSVLPLLTVAQPYLGNTLKYLATDSWELGGTNWTPAFREEFIKRRGYDPIPYLPVVAGRIVGSRDLSTRFLNDLRRTIADLINGHYDHLAALSKTFGLGIECESGGPHGAPFDALETFRNAAVVQTEYWAMSKEHRSADKDRFFVKEAAAAAHIYGKPLVAAEGMTSIGNQWNESLGLNLKPSFDQALTEGMNRLVWHEFTSSPPELGLPGQEYFAGTHLNPNVTWWRDAAAFTIYLNRAQFLLQQGQPVNDVLYYYGDNVPNFVRLKRDDPAQVLSGYDYDVTSTDALLDRIVATGPDLHTPEGIHYKAFVLPKSRVLPLTALQLAHQYLQSGGTLIGLRPIRPQGIISDADMKQFAAIADLWTPCEQSPTHHTTIGKGQLFCTTNAREALQTLNIAPDFDSADIKSLDYVHRYISTTIETKEEGTEADVYFIRNTQPKPLQTTITLRIANKQPELLNAVTGEATTTLLYTDTPDSRTTLPLTLEPYGSIFILFRHSAARHVTKLTQNNETLFDATNNKLPESLTLTTEALHTPTPGTYDLTYSDATTKHLTTPPAATPINLPTNWTLTFPPNWGAPSSVQLTTLQSWSESTDPGIRYFSGTATYRTTLHLTAAQLPHNQQLWLSFGEVHEVAAVRINGKAAETLWKQPWSLRADTLLHAGDNTIEIDVTNLWPNRLIGDAQSPTEKHYTWTNIATYTKNSPLLPSGLIGPVTLNPMYAIPLN
jgi:alpha-L-rhamnosidase